MSWWAFLPGTVLLVAAVFGPGWVLLRLAGLRGWLPLAGGPALSLAFFGVSGIGLDRLGIDWGWVPLFTILIAASAIAVGAGWWIRRDLRRRELEGASANPSGLWSKSISSLSSRSNAWLSAAILVSGLLIAIPIAGGMIRPDALLQQFDAIFHLNGVQAIRETGNASTFGAMQPLVGAAGDNYYYPTVWHGIIAIAPAFKSIAAAANASTFVFGGLVWLVGLAGLGSVLFAGRKHRVLLTVLTVTLGASFSAFPHFLLSIRAQWPFGTGVSLIPGTVALVVAAFMGSPGGVRLVSRARLTVTALIFVGAIGGVGLTHGSALFSLSLILVPFAVAISMRAVGHRWARGDRWRILTASGFGVIIIILAVRFLSSNRTIAGMLNFPRKNNEDYIRTAFRTVMDSSLGGGSFSSWPVALCVLAGFGWLVVELVRRRREPLVWIGGSWLLVIGMVALSAGPDVPLRLLTGFWYTETVRVAAVYPVVAAPLGAIGLVFVTTRVAAHVRFRVSVPIVAMTWVVVAAVVTSGWQMEAKRQQFVEAYVPDEIRWGTKASEEEIALLKRLPMTTEEDALILGDPANGAAFAWSVGERHVVLPHMGRTGMSQDQQVLRKRFNDINDDPKICEIVNRMGVTHFYQDTAGPEEGARSDKWAYGLVAHIDAGLRVVDRAGTATLYEITACG